MGRARGRRALPVALAALIALALAAGLLLRSPRSHSAPADAPIPPAERKPAPALEGAVLVPPPVTLASLRGRPAVVNFWASWCPPCRKEAPELARFDRERGSLARLVGVDYMDPRRNALAFVREFGWGFPNLVDPRGSLGARYRLVGLPSTYVLDARGRIARRLTGPQTYARLVRAVRSVR